MRGIGLGNVNTSGWSKAEVASPSPDESFIVYLLAREMDERVERRRLLAAWSIVVLAGIGHRTMLFALHRADLDALIDANAAWYSFQHLPREMLRDHLLGSLLLLQQTPPISNLILGVALKWCSWPVGVAYAMIWLQTLLTILT